ncbi:MULTISPECIES: BCCT family transporter [Vibrio]|uniref:BCCT family transporter n=1 Tax=Vibrio algicola TaxID=2662262 RepID=A0A5Q0TCM7_9VIBR|nr:MULTISPECIES: BCCT family transporter [Vibrio]MBD1577775.1 BCCT family transporter [Vibrio sp. S11_S32]
MTKGIDKYSIDSTDYTIGQDNVQKWGFDVHNSVFTISAGLILLFLIAILVTDASTAKVALDGVKNAIIDKFDVLFVLSGNLFVIFCLALIVSPFGKIRLGGDEAKAEHSYLSWLAMLFAAGMGIGLMFWSVAEPAAYYTDWFGTPLNVAANTPEAAKMALGATMYHWGLHPWAIYAVVALSLAFFTYNKGLPLSIRSIFYPILGDRTWGWPGHIIDILAVLATLFGLATSLGFGAQQAAAGIGHVFGIDAGVGLQLIVIVGVTILTTISVIRGIDGGVKLISNINMVVAFILLMFIIVVCFNVVSVSIPETIVSYVKNIIPLSNPFGREDEAWMHGWTVFYWAWWMSWSPFVGMFIARVSRGRTVREFVTAVLLLPTIITSVWMGAFGGVGIEQLTDKVGMLGQNGFSDVTMAMFQMFDALPMSQIISCIAILLILVFFVSSSDSGSLVIDSITAGGKIDSPVPQRIFWAVVQGAVAMALLWVGGSDAIGALQAAAVSTALPFVFVLLIMCVSLILGMRTEPRK